MRKLLTYLISTIKAEKWELDASIPIRYVVIIFMEKFIMAVRGLIKFGKFRQPILVGVHSKFYCKSLIKFNGAINIDKYCHINALSNDAIVFGNNVSIGKFTTIECSGTITNIGKGLNVGNNVGLGIIVFLTVQL